MFDCGVEIGSFLRFLPNRTEPVRPRGDVGGDVGGGDGGPPAKKKKKGDGSSSAFVQLGPREVFVDSALKYHVPKWGLVDGSWEDLSSIDAILISNYHNMLALPYITEHTSFDGLILATEPTVEIGRQLLWELVEFASSGNRADRPGWQDEHVLCSLSPALQALFPDVTSWKDPFGKRDVDNAIDRIRRLSYGESVSVFGGVTVTPNSAGYCLGSATWTVTTAHQKVVYLAECSTAAARHPLPLDIVPLRGCDMLLLGRSLAGSPHKDPEVMFQQFCKYTGATVSGGGNVLVPCYPSGVLLDLIDALRHYLVAVGLGRVPMYFVSPVCDSALAYANIVPEWLCKSKQDRSVLAAQPPFGHKELLRAKFLQPFPSIQGGPFLEALQEPCIAFAGHPSLRCGDAVELMRLWKDNPRNAVVFIEPGFDHIGALYPYYPMECAVHHIPIDPRMTFSEINSLIKEVRPGHLVLPHCYSATHNARGGSSASLHVMPIEGPLYTYTPLDVVHVPLPRGYARAHMSAELAQAIHPRDVAPGLQLSALQCRLHTRDGVHTLEPTFTSSTSPSSSSSSTSPSPSSSSMVFGGSSGTARLLWGQPALPGLLKGLAARGIHQVRVEPCEDGQVVVHLKGLRARVHLSHGTTRVETEGPLALQARSMLMDTLLAQIHQT